MAPKDAAARAREAAHISRQLLDLGCPAEALTEVEDALALFRDKGWGVTKTFKLRDLGVSVTLQLSTQAHVTSFARVRGLAAA